MLKSIESILNQQFADFEFVILDDASTDGSAEILKEWAQKDSRIRLFQSSECLGLSRSSNQVVSQCQTPVIARMDADDISHRDRLQLQFQILNDEPDVVAVGTRCIGIDAQGRVVRPRDRWRIVRRSAYIPFPHGSSMFRKRSFDEIGGYCEELKRGEDQDLFHRLAKKGRVVSLPNVLL
jgi:glycosyltransferase involved in cell wall biosynthesis